MKFWRVGAVAMIALVALLLLSCTVKQGQLTLDPEKPHHREGGFQNPYLSEFKKSTWGYLKARWFGEDEWLDPQLELDDMHTVPWSIAETDVLGQGVAASWLGHATFLLRSENLTVLTDPIFSDRASPVSFAGPERLIPLPLDPEDLPAVDYVLISHNHYDHLDERTIRWLGNTPTYLVPLGVGALLEDFGINRDRIIELDWWQNREFEHVSITATPSQHWSARGIFDRRSTLWASWLLDLEGIKVWFAGDTGYNEVQFKQIGEFASGVDLALIPIGAYEPRWFMQDHHIDPTEAVQIHQDIGARTSIAMHWGTFQLTAEGLMAPKQALMDARLQLGVSANAFQLLWPGETAHIGR